MVILGVDPGYATVGCGTLKYQNGRFDALDARAIITPAKTPFEKRLLSIYQGIKGLLTEFNPDAIALEELFFSHNQTTGMAVAHARGVILLAAAEHGVEPFEYGPLQVKQAVTGYGKAEKRQMMEMTKSILRLAELPKPDDVADALAVAICHGNSSGPNALRAAVEKQRREKK